MAEKIELNINKESKQKACEFMQKLINLRKEKAISQTELSEKLGIKQPSLSRIEKTYPFIRLDTAFKMANALGMEIVLVKKNN